tara:strand:+ start:194 stop:580 length:387 start_codon:yes stop_codon:yes gene_type:complete
MIKKNMSRTNKNFMDHNGGLELEKIDENNYFFSSVIKEIHLNNGKIAHGGYLTTLADTGMGTAAHMVSKKKCVTISLEVKFISATLLSQTLSGKVKIQKKTKSLVFVTCEIFNSESVAVAASGVWKIL